MATYSPVYGELLTAKETAQLTGFTMNQLRNWRIPARQSLAPFGFVSIGVSPHYRKVVVQDYLEECGAQTANYVMTERDKKFPLGTASSNDLAKIEASNILSKITTETVYKWLGKELDKKYSFLRTWEQYWALTGKPYVKMDDRMTDLSWFEAAVQTKRLYINDLQGVGLTTEEILAMPVGAVPPLVEK